MMYLKKIKLFIFPIISGLMLYFAWPNTGIFPLLFIGFIPLLFSLEQLAIESLRFTIIKAFLLSLITYIVWLSLTLLWLYKTAVDSHFITVVLTALNYSVFLALFPLVYKKLGKLYALIYFASSFLLADWISQVFMLTTPYFNLGLGLGMTPWLIQHYKWIGAEGGTLWIISINVLIFSIISEKNYTLKKIIPLVCLAILIPIISFIQYQSPTINNKSSLITLHQAAFKSNSQEAYDNPVKTINTLFDNTFNNFSKAPDIVVWPETVIIRLGWLHNIDNEPVIIALKARLKDYPNTTVVFGAIGFSEAKNDKEITNYTTYVADGNYYFNTHNVAVTVSTNNPTLIKSKEKFIPFHERIPYMETAPFLKNVVKTLGTQVMFTPFENDYQYTADFKGNQFESILCYESLFSLFMIKKSTKKIGAFIIHANEHWLKDISGSEQYLYQNIAIAIQGGKPLLRSSNSGVSAIVTEKGDIVSPIIGNSNKNITSEVPLNYNTTLYSKIAGSFYAAGSILCLIFYTFSILKKS